VTERELQQAVIECAHVLGWRCAQFRVARTAHGWRTPVQADGAGFSDLILVRRGRVVACELKADRGQLTDQQHDWLRALAAARVETHVWRPADWTGGEVERVLR
jgi:hypothetical protein